MKNKIKDSRKTVFLMLLLTTGFFANAQTEKVSTPSWSTSKDVQKIANKKLFEDLDLRRSHIEATALTPTWMISKGVHQINANNSIAKGNIKSTGMPTWIISKGVHRIGKK